MNGTDATIASWLWIQSDPLRREEIRDTPRYLTGRVPTSKSMHNQFPYIRWNATHENITLVLVRGIQREAGAFMNECVKPINLFFGKRYSLLQTLALPYCLLIRNHSFPSLLSSALL